MNEAEYKNRVKQLAETLQATGIAASQARAEEMAEDIVKTEIAQLKGDEKKSIDKDLNPQQRVGSQAKPEPAKDLNLDEDYDDKTPISELLGEETDASDEPVTEEAPEAPEEPEQEAKPETQEDDPKDEEPKEEDSELEAPDKPSEEKPEVVPYEDSSSEAEAEDEPEVPETEPKTVIVEDTDYEPPKEQSATAPDRPEEQSPRERASPDEPPKPQESEGASDHPKREEEKVDLSEMFDFSKR